MRSSVRNPSGWFIGLVIVIALPAHAQTPTTLLDRLFAEVPAELAPSGVLHDRVLSLASVGALDGTAPAPVVATSRWRQAWSEMRRSGAELRPLDELQRRVRAVDPHTVPVGVLDLRYDRLREDAAGTADLQIVGKSLRIEPGALVGAELFTAAALRERTFHGERVRFDLSGDWWFGNRGRAPRRIWFDADDGRGEREIADPSLLVRYDRSGAKLLRLRVEWPDGSRQEAAFAFEVAALVVPAPDDTLRVTGTVPFAGAVASGDAWIYRAPGHATLVRPVVVVEGFDLDNSLNWDEIYTLLNTENLLEDIRADGYDLVVLNFDDATDYIQRNSLLLVELLQQVQNGIDPAAHYTLAGASMGALCSRYALAWMEQNAVEHRVNTWISFDGPHSGANIPLGLQYWLDFFAGESADAAFLLSRLDRPAARQLLVYHYTDPSGPGLADPLRTAFEGELAALGGYPVQPRRVAIANGSGTALDQGYAPGAQLLDWEYDSFLVDIRGNVWAVSDGPAQRVFQGLIDPILLPATQKDVTVSGTDPFDNAPGGSRASLAQADATAAPYGDIVALHAAHCFIPTVSALDLPTTDLFFDVSSELDPATLSPFDALYFPAENQEHVLVTPQNAQWFRQELLATPTGVGPAPRRGLVLHGNRPNPFNPATLIEFEVFEATRVRAEIFDARGRRVRTLLDELRPPGRQRVRWDGTDAAGRRVGSGVYYCRIEAGREARAASLVLLK